MVRGDETMADHVWVVVANIWLVVGCSREIMAGRGRSWVLAAKFWLVVGGRGWLHDSNTHKT